ncbi:MAG TPA: hypothetical protein VGO60_02755, partial [Iamia sp.]|nr:hypothetical protein [Iamia sp.]
MSILEKEPAVGPSSSSDGTPILKVTDLSVTYTVRGRAAGGKAKGLVSAVDGVDLHVKPGETLGLVG